MVRPILTLAFLALSFTEIHAQDRPMLEIVWPHAGAVIELGSDPEKTIGVVVKSNFALFPALQCAGNHPCGHIHMKIDPKGDSCLRRMLTGESALTKPA